MRFFDVVVVGGGHAGVEAACAAHRLGVGVLLVTISKNNLGEVSCNPAIGGVGKGTIVKEIDALDGVMPKVADLSGINFKVLNSSRGPAVWGLRTQIDRNAYKKNLQETLKTNYPGLVVVEDFADDVVVVDGCVQSVVLRSLGEVFVGCLVVTTGTFLSAVMHKGFKEEPGGRVGEPASGLLANSLEKLGFSLGRLKTGTTPRLIKNTINTNGLEVQSADKNPVFFSAFTEKTHMKQVDCFVTYTNKNTHNVILSNKQKSPVFMKKIPGKGPRYCVCIEDKMIRFADKERHHVFLEPEGLDSDWFYPNGITTSMPEDVQLAFLRTIGSLECVEVGQYGYAVSYCFVNPVALFPTLETKKIKNLFFAGQINGTTGYEEAAGQGIVAGINAGIKCKDPSREFVLSRTGSYIGVMIDDITTNGVGDEPYRVFTSRAEYRLRIRADNAYTRVLPFGINVGCVGSRMCDWFKERQEKRQKLLSFLQNNRFLPSQLEKMGFKVTMDGRSRSLFFLLGCGFVLEDFFESVDGLAGLVENTPKDVVFEVVNDAFYYSYVKRQDSDVEKVLAISMRKIDSSFDYSSVLSLSREEVEKLSFYKPTNLNDASKIPGITPSAIVAIMYAISKKSR